MIELNDIRSKVTITTPKGATVVLWSDTLWSTTSKLQAEAVKNVKTGSDGKPVFDASSINMSNYINDAIIDRIVSWDYSINGEPLPITVESLNSLPADEVQFIQDYKVETDKEQKDFLAE